MATQSEFIGSPKADAPKWTGLAAADLQGVPICPIPCARARVIVTIDGTPYAGFIDLKAAKEAVKLWSGQMTVGWSAVRGRVLTIVKR